MKAQELKQLIREEIRRVLKEIDNVVPTEPTKPIGMSTFLKSKSVDPTLSKGLSTKEIKVIQNLINLVLQKAQKGDVTFVANKVTDILANLTKSIKSI